MGPTHTTQSTGQKRRAQSSRAASLSRDEIFELLSNQRRRQVIDILARHDGEAMELSDVARQIAAWESGTTVDDIDYEDRKRVHTSLYQFHAPKMEEHGVVAYDSQAGTIRLAERASDVEAYLDACPTRERERPWERYFLSISVGSLVALTGAWLGVVPFASLPTVAWELLCTVAFLGVSVAYALDGRGGDDDRFPALDD